MAPRTLSGIQPKVVQPVARPVDTFVQTKEGQQLAQLADALSGLSSSVSRFGSTLEERKGAREKIEGENAAREALASGLSYKAAIEQQVITPDKSPWFQVGAKETFGRVLGNRYADDLSAEFAKSPQAQSSNPADFDAFEQEFRKTWTQTHLGPQQDQYFTNAFGNTSEGRIAGLRANFAQQAGAKLVRQTGEAFHAEIFQTVQQFRNGKLPLPELTAAIKLAQDRQAAVGMSYSILNNLTGQAVVAAAVRLRDPALLDVLDQLGTGKGGGKVAGLPEIAAAREDALASIANANDNEARDAAAREKRDRDKVVDGIFDKLTDELAAAPDPRKVKLDPYIELMAKTDRSQIELVRGVAAQFGTQKYEDDPDVLSRLNIGIHMTAPGQSGYVTKRMVSTEFAAGNLSASSYRQLISDIKERDEAGGSSKFLRDPFVSRLSQAVKDGFVNELGVMGGSAVAMNAQNAADEAVAEYIRWSSALGREPGEEEALKKVNDIYNRRVLKRLDIKTQTMMQPIKVPKANFGTGSFSAFESPVVYTQLKADINAVREGRKNSVSPEHVTLLMQNGVDPRNKKQVDEFLAAQDQWYALTLGRRQTP